jgi:putative heme-binding domain-containing protein
MRINDIILRVLTAAVVLAPSAWSQDVGIGRELFQANCVGCHGPDGASVRGVDLGHGTFKQASSDEDLVKIIRQGIPGTAMPAQQFFEASDAEAIVGYLHKMASAARAISAPGDAIQGKALFEGRGRCVICHQVAGRGSGFGPELTEIGNGRRAVELERSIVDPDAEILPENRSVRALTRHGDTVGGRLLNHDTFTVQFIDTRERLHSVLRSELREFSIERKSPMPSYKEKFSTEELADIVSYLVSLKGN